MTKLAGPLILAGAAVMGVANAPAPAAPAKPDIIVILFDDVGFSDFGAFGSEIRTPTIDALASGGLRYTRFDTKALCSPTRAALLTGRNSQTVGMGDLASHARTQDPADDTQFRGNLFANAQTVADALRRGGYETYALGKWHLTPRYEGGPGSGPATSDVRQTSWPLQRGFSHYYGFLSGWTDQYRPKLVSDNTPIPTPRRPDYLLTTDLIDHAIADLEDGRRTGKPAFLYLALGAAHAPIQVPHEYADRYDGVYSAGWDAIRAARFARMKTLGIIPADTVLPPSAPGDVAWNSLDAAHQRVYARYMAVYAGVIAQADEQLGRLVAYLKASGRFDNTVIMLMSDNGAAGEGGAEGGFVTPYHDRTPFAEIVRRLSELGGPNTEPLYPRPWAMASVAPMRRYKGWPYNGGVRDPLIVSWPRAIAGHGAIRSQPIDVIDVAPTLLDVAGTRFAETVDGVRQIPVAGASFRATFASSAAGPPRDVQFFELRGDRAIRVGNWRAVATHQPGTSYEQDAWQLFDLSNDASEATDLASRNPAKLAELKARWWQEARKYANPPLPDPSKGRADDE